MRLKKIFSLLNIVTIVIMVALSLILLVTVTNTNSELKWVVHTYNVINKAEAIMMNMLDQETGMRGYLATGNEVYLEPYNDAIKRFDDQIDALKVIVSDNPSQVNKLEVISKLADQWHEEAADNYLSIKREIIHYEDTMVTLRNFSTSGIGKRKMDHIRQLLSAVDDENLRLNILISMINMETGVRAFIINMDDLYLEPYFEGMDVIADQLAMIDNVEIHEAINDWIESVGEKQIELVKGTLSNKTKDDLHDEISKGRGKAIMDEIRHEVDQFVIVEERLLSQRSLQLNNQYQLSIAVIIVAVVLIFMVGLLRSFVINRVTNPLEKFTRKMKEIDPNDIKDVKLDEHYAVYEMNALETSYNDLLKELKVSQDELKRLTRIDQLTKVYNRRWFDENLDLETRRARRNGNPLTLLMIDIDHFKSFNDTYGHVEGDACLMKVAETINKSLHRVTDNVARYGGEEFVVILPETDKEGGVQIAEMIRNNIYALEIENMVNGEKVHLSISIGVASTIPLEDFQGEKLVEYADNALYEAKERGRNQTYTFE